MKRIKTIEYFIKNLAYYSYEKKLNINDLARILGVSQSTISMWRTGKAFPRIEVLEKLADCFGVTVAELLTDREHAPSKEDIEENTDSNQLLNEFTEEEQKIINEFAEFLKSKKN